MNNILVVGGLILSTLGWGQVPPVQKEFLEKFGKTVEGLQEDFKAEESTKSSTERLLKSIVSNLIKSQIVKPEEKLEVVKLSSSLNAKLAEILKKEVKELSFGDLNTILSKHSSELTDKEKSQLVAALLVYLNLSHKKSGDRQAALKSIIMDYLKSQAALTPNKPVELSDELRKLLGIEKKEDKKEDEAQRTPENLISLLKNRKEPLPEKAGMELLSNLIENQPVDSERLTLSMKPAIKQFFEALSNAESHALAKPSTFEEAFNLAGDALKELRAPEVAPNPGRLQFTFPDEIKPINHLGAGGLSGRGSFHSGGRGGVAGEPNPAAAGLSNLSEDEKQDIQACLDKVKQEPRYNVELRLPGALCASTALSVEPTSEKSNLRERASSNPSAFCSVKLGTAVHCVNSTPLTGARITARIGGHSVNAQVLRVGSVDGNQGEPVAEGNPDLALMQVEMLCSEAQNINFAKVPNSEDIRKLYKGKIPVVLQQNSEINASLSGSNGATIAAAGGMGDNFLAFNTNIGKSGSNSPINNSNGVDIGPLNGRSLSGISDSDRIKSGDSGGTALSCIRDGNHLKVVYAGAISHIDVTGDSREGKTGGIASGNSLQRLSSLLKADDVQKTANRHIGHEEPVTVAQSLSGSH